MLYHKQFARMCRPDYEFRGVSIQIFSDFSLYLKHSPKYYFKLLNELFLTNNLIDVGIDLQSKLDPKQMQFS